MSASRKILSLLFIITPLFLSSTAFAATALAGQADTISANWSGYVADTAASYSAVGATWAVPAPSATDNPLATDATWVGVGGVKANDLIQAGTQAVIENGQVAYQAWYELLPKGQVILPLAINGNDSVTVFLTETSAGIWHLSFIDNTSGKSYGTNIAYNSSKSSAEWVEERPVIESRRMMSYLPLDNFGTINFTGGYTIADGTRQSIAASGAQSMNMASRGTELATTSAVSNDSFSITRSATDASITTTQPTTFAITSPTTRTRHRFPSSGFTILPTQSSGSYVIVVTFR